MLLGLTGSLLIAWHYHIDVDPRLIALHFLGLNAGYVIAAAGAQRLIGRFGVRPLAVTSCALAAASLLALSFVAPPVPAAWRILGLACAREREHLAIAETLEHVRERPVERHVGSK